MKNDHGLFLTDDNHVIGYLIFFDGHIYSPDGPVDVTPAEKDEHNRLLSQAEIAGLDANCKIGIGGVLYYSAAAGVTTWLGDIVASPKNVRVRGSVITFTRNGRTYRGRLQQNADCFNFRRVK